MPYYAPLLQRINFWKGMPHFTAARSVFMKRFVFLAAVVAVGAAAAVMYGNSPAEPVMVTVAEAEDGSIELVESTKSDNSDKNATDSDDSVNGEKNAVSEVGFSMPAAFYSENISVQLSANKGAEIYFTTDGSDPVISEKNRYIAPIDINAGTETRAVTIKAICVDNGEKSEIFTRSFVVGQDVRERFSQDTLVFVLSTDPYNLYDYEYGIAVPGKIYDEYVAEHPGEEIPYNAPGNYYMSGREGERDIYVEVFESSGRNVISQAAGVRLSGGYSRVVDQKSLRLIARREYDSRYGKFEYPFFPDAVTESGKPISKYDRLVLRNGANDREFAGVRDELSGALARDYGYPVTQCAVPAAVFLNGEYYGFAWLHENYNEDYLETYFGGNKEQYEIIANTEYPEEGSEQALADYAKVTEYFEKDLTNDAVFEEFCELVDIDNLMQYYAIQIFISNKDWPGNNYKIFRYYPQEGEEITSEFMDGRWRYMLFDAEYAWGLYGDGFKVNTLSDLLTGKHMSGESKALIALLEREDMRVKLANNLCDIMSDAFSTENILETLEELIEKSDPEQMYALERGITSEWANPWSFADNREQIRDFAQNRKNFVTRHICKQFDYENETFDISLTGARGATAVLSSQTTVGGLVYGSYFTACGVPISAEVFDGFKFLKWEINGEEFFEPDIVITADMAKDGRVDIKLFTEQAELHETPPQITEICTDKGAGWIKLYNPNSEPVSTHGLFLTDGEENLKRWELPSYTIKPREELLIVMKNNKTSDALMQYQANFSLKAGETLILSDSDGSVLRRVPIPEIPESGIYTLGDNGNYYVK